MTPNDVASAIPPVRFHAVLPESDSDFGKPRSAMCLNQGLTDAELQAFAPVPAPVPRTHPRLELATVLTLGAGIIASLLGALEPRSDTAPFVLLYFGMATFSTGIALLAVTLFLSYKAGSSANRARAAGAALIQETWARNGGRLIRLDTLPSHRRRALKIQARQLADARKALIRLAKTNGAVSDGALAETAALFGTATTDLISYAKLPRLPKHGARMAEADHLTDLAVLRKAAEYKDALTREASACNAMTSAVRTAVSAVTGLAATRDDRELIALANR